MRSRGCTPYVTNASNSQTCSALTGGLLAIAEQTFTCLIACNRAEISYRQSDLQHIVFAVEQITDEHEQVFISR